ncbi:MAG: phospholipase D family protein [Gammaproteobacteria bacterium]
MKQEISYQLQGGLRVSVALALLVLGGCATVNFDYPKTESTYDRDTADTYLAKRVAPSVAEHPGESAFLMQSDGVEALAARVLGAFHAERTIDVQYYLIKDDPIGVVFIEALLKAADRGVRVRLLLDDVFTKGYDKGMAALDEHPHVEIRIFNPVARGGSRVLNGLSEARRVNRRMHNKTFIVDNSAAIIGGRNIAAEYFAGRKSGNFGDLDAVCYGPIVSELSQMFDEYWNDRLAVPMLALVDVPDNSQEIMADLRARFEESRKALDKTPYAQALLGSFWKLDKVGAREFDWAPYELVYDLPEKGRNKSLDPDQTIVTPLREAVLSAEDSIMILTPYFVPRKPGMELMRTLVERGIEVKIITNSLAANNQPLVHSGYAPVRKKLLEIGVKLYEVRPDAPAGGVSRVSDEQDANNTMHIKTFIVDRETVFLGSFNFDPRSAYINTESGVIIDSPELGSWAVDAVDEVLAARTYELELNSRYQLRWKTQEKGQWVTYKKEPQTTAWQRFKVRFFSLLPIKNQL